MSYWPDLPDLAEVVHVVGQHHALEEQGSAKDFLVDQLEGDVFADDVSVVHQVWSLTLNSILLYRILQSRISVEECLFFTNT